MPKLDTTIKQETLDNIRKISEATSLPISSILNLTFNSFTPENFLVQLGEVKSRANKAVISTSVQKPTKQGKRREVPISIHPLQIKNYPDIEVDAEGNGVHIIYCDGKYEGEPFIVNVRADGEIMMSDSTVVKPSGAIGKAVITDLKDDEYYASYDTGENHE
jgi:hypothetical protein